MDNVVRLKDVETTTVTLLKDLLESNLKDELDGLVIIASTNGEIFRWFFDADRRCSNILGLIEYMKQYVIDYMREDGLL